MNIGLTLIGQMITFSVLIWFTMKFIWPPLIEAMEMRRKKIADGLAAAEKGHKILELSEDNARTKLREARELCNAIIADANKQALRIIEEAQKEAEQERGDIIASGRAQIKQELHAAKTKLQGQMADIVVLGAQKILARSVNADDHRDLLDKITKEMAG